MATSIFDSAPRTFSALGQMRYKNAYKRRLMDRCIMRDLCNGNPENIKSFIGSGKGAKVTLYVPGTVVIRDTQPDGGIVYQQVTDATEEYSVNRESYWALKFRPEDMAYMPWDPKSEYFTNATDQLARHIEKAFGADILGKVPAYNTGHAAGKTSRAYDLGTTTEPVTLYKTQSQCDLATGVQHRDVAADHFIKIANALRDAEGQAGGHVSIVCAGPLKHLIQTSELKFGGLMGQRNLELGIERGGRADVKFLGTMDDTVTLIQDNIMFPCRPLSSNPNVKVYPIFAMMKDACAYIDDTVFRDNAMKDVGSWDEHHRAKQIYDWPVVFPSMMAVSYVTIAEPAYSAG